jgi:tetratricopeptide (TPR) repeat protein
MKSTAEEEPEAHKRGVQLEQAGKLEEALAAFEELESGGDYSRLAASLCKARVLWKLARPAESAQAYRLATELKPDSNVATLGLYHTLMDAGQFDEAVAEGQRFFEGRWGAPDPDPNVEKYRVGLLALIGMDEDNLQKCRDKVVDRARAIREESES